MARGASGEPDFLDEGSDALRTRRLRDAVELQGELDVFPRRKGREEVEKLEDGADRFAPDPAEPVLVEVAEGNSPDLDAPSSGRSIPAMQLRRVLLPEPDGPIRATRSPGSSERETPRSTGVVP